MKIDLIIRAKKLLSKYGYNIDEPIKPLKVAELMAVFYESETGHIKSLNSKDIFKQSLSEFLKEVAEKHNTPIESLNIHIDGNVLIIQKYTFGGYKEFEELETLELSEL